MPEVSPRITMKVVRNVVVSLTALIIVFIVGYKLGNDGIKFGFAQPSQVTIDRKVPSNKDLDFSLFWRVWDTLDASYFDHSALDQTEMVYGAIKGMVASLGDPYTIFLDPRENEVTEEDLNGNFEGVGIQIGYRGTNLAVIAPLPDTPAAAAGVEGGDYILAIKDKEKEVDQGTGGITLPEAVQLIRGKAGSTVTLTLLRDGTDDPFDVDLKREAIDVPSLKLSFVGENEDIAHVEILKFGGETFQEWNDAVLEILKRPNIKGVILDVRSNPGGYLQSAIDISSEFLEIGDTVVIEEHGDESRDEYKVERLGRLRGKPVVLLVDGGSASASEILAGALRDDLNAKLVGSTTFGKGTIQEPRELENGVGLHITIAKWLTPKGTWVNENPDPQIDSGLAPDVKIEDNNDTEQDEVLDTAINLLAS